MCSPPQIYRKSRKINFNQNKYYQSSSSCSLKGDCGTMFRHWLTTRNVESNTCGPISYIISNQHLNLGQIASLHRVPNAPRLLDGFLCKAFERLVRYRESHNWRETWTSMALSKCSVNISTKGFSCQEVGHWHAF